MKHRIITVALMVLLTSGCEKGPLPEARYTYTDDGKKQAAAFIEQCLSGANPKSDEEPEDWIPICMRQARQMYGTRTDGFYYQDTFHHHRTVDFVPCAKAKSEEEKRLCGS